MSAPEDPDRVITVALLGAGTVGAQVGRLLNQTEKDLTPRVGAPMRLVGVAALDPENPRDGIDPAVFSSDAHAVATSGADIVVELMGGIEPARTLILAAIAAGSSVVTANKALLAAHGAELQLAAQEAGVDLFFEASVAGAIPLLRPLRESLAGDRVTKVMGIVNGSTNYMLTKMDEEGCTYQEIFEEAKALGYLEADPSLDIDGHDAAAKAAILAELAFHTHVTIDDVYCEGISKVTADDVRAAQAMGFVIKLLAIAERAPGDTGIIVRVHPTMVPRSHPLASVRLAFNAVFVQAEAADELMFYGRGAGGVPTASAILGDVVVAARNRVTGSIGPSRSVYADLPVLPISSAQTRFYVNLDVVDRPGVLASIAAAFAQHGISIQVVRQDGHGDQAGLIVRTHRADEEALEHTVEHLRGMDEVKAVLGVMRVEGEAGD
jgi:homoserine dehydrogenase